MGTRVQIDNYLPGHCSMRDLSRESNGVSWPSCYGDNGLPNGMNGHCYYGFLPRTIASPHPGYDKDVLKQKMLEHEAIFKDQVYELHRLYQVQRDLMDEVRRKEQFKHRIPYETSSSSSPVPSQMHSEDVQRWNGQNLPSANSVNGRRPISVPSIAQSFPHSTNGESIIAAPSPLQNFCSPKNSEVSESRPTKFRKRMLDLQLPADEYFDTNEVDRFDDTKVSDNISPSPDANGKFASGNGFLNYPGKKECNGDASRSDSHVIKSKTLADLNEPLNVEETTAVSNVDFVDGAASHSDVQCRDLSAKFLSSMKDVPQHAGHGRLNGDLNNLPLENKPNGLDWFCYVLESEQHEGSARSIDKGTPRIPSQPVHSLLGQAVHPPAFLTCDRIKGDPWRSKSGGNVEKSDRTCSLPNYNAPEPILSSHVPNQLGLFHPSDLSKTWNPCASSWGKLNGCLTQKLPVQTSPFLCSAALDESPPLSSQNNNLFGNKWNLNSSAEANVAFRSKPPMRNGFYQGSSTSVKEPPIHFSSVGFDYVNSNFSDKTAPCSSNIYFKAATFMSVNPVKDVNLNIPLPNGVSKDHISQPDLNIVDNDHKSKDPLAVLPWLRGKDLCSNEAESSRKSLNALEAVLSGGPSFPSSSYNGDVKAKELDSSDCMGSRKILGVPIFEKPLTPKKENTTIISSSAICHLSRKEEVECNQRKDIFDINLPCEPADCELDMNVEVGVIEKKIKSQCTSVRNHFDLNSCITEEVSTCETSLLDNSPSIKRGTGIDLEAPVVLDSEEDVLQEENLLIKEPKEQIELLPAAADDREAELSKSAAEAIIAISSSFNRNQAEVEATSLPPEASEEEWLRWFVDIACSSGNDPESKVVLDERDEKGEDGDGLPKGLDEFESMTLRLKDCNEEEYFPKPGIPDIPNIEENSYCVLTRRTRRGQARRGRQRRDFQRDILPGLASLSRHEVTEDLQTFGGLMKATGHPWHSGPNRRNATRNACARGRRRSVAVVPPSVNTVCAPLKLQQSLSSSNSEAVLEDRSLTGWGKTTRRPRRQRHPAGNPPRPVALS